MRRCRGEPFPPFCGNRGHGTACRRSERRVGAASGCAAAACGREARHLASARLRRARAALRAPLSALLACCQGGSGCAHRSAAPRASRARAGAHLRRARGAPPSGAGDGPTAARRALQSVRQGLPGQRRSPRPRAWGGRAAAHRRAAMTDGDARGARRSRHAARPHRSEKTHLAVSSMSARACSAPRAPRAAPQRITESGPSCPRSRCRRCCCTASLFPFLFETHACC